VPHTNILKEMNIRDQVLIEVELQTTGEVHRQPRRRKERNDASKMAYHLLKSWKYLWLVILIARKSTNQ
jgi:hypothetical protein